MKLLFTILFICFSQINGNWNKASLTIWNACKDCHYFVDFRVVVSTANEATYKSVDTITGQIGENRLVWNREDEEIKKITSRRASMLGCVWTTQVNNNNDCQKHLNVLKEAIDEYSEGRRLGQSEAEYEQATLAILRRIFGASVRFSRRVIRRLRPTIRRIKSFFKRPAVKALMGALEVGLLTYSIVEVININKMSKEIAELNKQLKNLSGYEIGFLVQQYKLECDGIEVTDDSHETADFVYTCE